MTGPEFPRQRHLWDACDVCPDTPRVQPLLATGWEAGTVAAGYVCPRCGRAWTTVWAYDEQPEGRSS